MKQLQPEMVRLKEIHKDDKMKLQQAMMALYKKEKGKSYEWLLAHPSPDTCILCFVQGFIRNNRNASHAFLWLDPRPKC